MLTGPYAHFGPVVLGVLLVIYAIVGLSKFSFSVTRPNEKWIGGIVGLITGLVSAVTGIQVIPSMPYMQAIGMERDELGAGARRILHRCDVGACVQSHQRGTPERRDRPAGRHRHLSCAFAGMFVGQAVRSRMQPDAFRRWFLIAMILLGIYIAGTCRLQYFAMTARLLI